MRPSAFSPALVVACIGLVCTLAAAPGAAPAREQQRLDAVLAAYTAGDHEAVARAFTHSNNFQQMNALNVTRFDRWLGAWSPIKADFLIELIDRASAVAPAYVPSLVISGQRYVLRRPDPPGVSAQDDALERRWHVMAIAFLQRHVMGPKILQYIELLQSRRPLPASAAVWDPRISLARGIAQEQVCRAMHATARHDRTLTELEGAAATPPALRQMAIECMQAVARFFDAAAAHDTVRDEARTRGGFAAFQLGRNADAAETLESARAGADRTLAYWRALFRGRVADAMGADRDAERAYREAATLFPDAQSAHIGLALALFRLNQHDQAEEAGRAARRANPDAIDPWESYFEGDARFVREWMAAMRTARR